MPTFWEWEITDRERTNSSGNKIAELDKKSSKIQQMDVMKFWIGINDWIKLNILIEMNTE